MTRVLIAEGSVLLREGLDAVLRRTEMTVVGKVGNVDAMLASAAAGAPDVALVGIRKRSVVADEGPPAEELMRQHHPNVALVVLSASFDAELALWLLKCRPVRMGYLLTEPVPDAETLLRAVRVVADGGTFVDRSAIERLRSAPRRTEPLDHLSEREREILTLMAAGRTNRGICDALFLSPKTVEGHVRAIFQKLNLRPAPDEHRRVLAVLRYLDAGTTNTRSRAGNNGVAAVALTRRTPAALAS